MPARERFEIAIAPLKARPPARGRTVGGASKFKTRSDEIVRAAVEPLNRHGLRGMTLSLVAARLKLAPTAVGYYFKKKEDLAAACYLVSLARLEDLVAEAALSGRDGPQALIRLFFEFRRCADAGEVDEIAWFEDVRTIHNAEVNLAYIAFFRSVRDLFGPVAPDQRMARNVRTHMLLSQLYWAIGWLPLYHPHDYGRMADRVIDIFEHGMAAPGRVWPSDFPALDIQGGGDDPRQMFLRAATETINELGYLGASVQKISERLNMTKGAFYHHHEAKNDLVVHCFEHTWRVVAETQAAADEATGDGLTNLASVGCVLVRRQLAGETAMLRAAALAAVPIELRPQLIAGFARTAARFTSVFSDGVADGSIRPMEVTVAAHMLSGAINSAAELHFWASVADPQHAAQLHMRPLFMGLFTQPLDRA